MAVFQEGGDVEGGLWRGWGGEGRRSLVVERDSV